MNFEQRNMETIAAALMNGLGFGVCELGYELRELCIDAGEGLCSGTMQTCAFTSIWFRHTCGGTQDARGANNRLEVCTSARFSRATNPSRREAVRQVRRSAVYGFSIFSPVDWLATKPANPAAHPSVQNVSARLISRLAPSASSPVSCASDMAPLV